MKKPFYKRWWFLLLCVCTVLAGVLENVGTITVEEGSGAETLLYVVVPLLWGMSMVVMAICLLSLLIKKVRKKDASKTKRWLIASLSCALVTILVIGTYPTGEVVSNDDSVSGEVEQTGDENPVSGDVDQTKNDDPAVNPTDKDEEQPKALAFLDDFTEYGYTAEQIGEIRKILVNVGITEITDYEIQDNSVAEIQVVKGLAYKDTSFMADANDEVQVTFNVEKGTLYLVAIYCPSYYSANRPTYLSGLEDRRADLYYDVEGGYLKKIDWENKVVVDYD